MSSSMYVSIACAKSTRTGSVSHWYSSPMIIATTSSATWSTSTSGRSRPRLLVVEQRPHELPRHLVALDEEVVQRVVVVETLGTEDEV